MPGITDSGVVMLLIAVSGMLTTVELLGFVALAIVKLNAPSAFVAFLVILIVGGPGSFVLLKKQFTESLADITSPEVVPCETPLMEQSDATKFQFAGMMVSVIE